MVIRPKLLFSTWEKFKRKGEAYCKLSRHIGIRILTIRGGDKPYFSHQDLEPRQGEPKQTSRDNWGPVGVNQGLLG